jgi:hypothetical protein
MGLTEKAKELADVTFLRAGKFSESAREKAPDFIDKAADATVKAIDAATSGIDRVTGGKFHEKLDGAVAKMEEGLDRPRSAGATTVTAEVVDEPGTAPSGPAAGATGQDAPKP